ncbi:MAG: hypothetical protein LDLANPLL_00541 [Turneriella sp.]|nr:hypothetical protein [Turneriella sp.]
MLGYPQYNPRKDAKFCVLTGVSHGDAPLARPYKSFRRDAKFCVSTILILLFVFLIPIHAQGKIKLRRSTPTQTAPANTATAAPAVEEEYTTSKGPEAHKRTLYLGLLVGMNAMGPNKSYDIPTGGLTSAQKGRVESALENGNSWQMSPIVGLRSELYFQRIYGIVLDIAYQQNRSYVLDTQKEYVVGQGMVPSPITGYMRSDYMIAHLMFSYRYSPYKALSKVKFLRPIASYFKPIAGNLQIGGFIKTPLSAQLEIQDPNVADPNDPFYDTKNFTKPVSFGVMGGIGFEVRLGSAIFFFEGQYFRGLSNTFGEIKSRLFNTAEIAEQGIYASTGFKFGIYGF